MNRAGFVARMALLSGALWLDPKRFVLPEPEPGLWVWSTVTYEFLEQQKLGPVTWSTNTGPVVPVNVEMDEPMKTVRFLFAMDEKPEYLSLAYRSAGPITSGASMGAVEA